MFFDDVRVPVANRVGEEGKGWTYGKYLLEFERGSGIASAKLRGASEGGLRSWPGSEVTGRAIDDPDIAARMSEVEVDIDTLEMTELRVLSRASDQAKTPARCRRSPNCASAKISEPVTRLGVDVIGSHDALAGRAGAAALQAQPACAGDS